MGFRPFGNVPDILSQLAAQKLGPQGQLLEMRMREANQNMIRSNLLTKFLVNADLKNFKPSDIMTTVSAIMSDPNLAIKAAETRFQEGLFSESRDRLRQLGDMVQQFGGAETEGGEAITPQEFVKGSGQILREGGGKEEIGILGNLVTQPQTITPEAQALIEQRKASTDEIRARIRSRYRNPSRLSVNDLGAAIDDTRIAIRDLQLKSQKEGLTDIEADDLRSLQQRHRDLIKEQDKKIGREPQASQMNRIRTLKRMHDRKFISDDKYKAEIKALFDAGVPKEVIAKELGLD